MNPPQCISFPHINPTFTYHSKQIIKIQSVLRGYNIRKSIPQAHLNAVNTVESSSKLNKHFKPQSTNQTQAQITSNQQIQILSKLSTNSSLISIENLNTVMSEFPLTTQFQHLKLIVRPIHEYENKSLYLGEWNIQTNKRHGRGIIQWNDGSKYEGYWVNDKANIKGRLLLSSGDIYEGEWKDDKASGHGVYHKNNGECYDGEWENDKQSGNGYEKWPDGSCYKGEYRNGMKNGKGVFKWYDGSEFNGDFVDNNIEGKGVYKWKNGNEYNGEWKNNKMHGQGVFIWKDGRKYNGEFKNDKREGNGELIWNDGRVYKGKWMNGVQHGEGLFYNPKTKEWINGKWDKGKRIE